MKFKLTDSLWHNVAVTIKLWVYNELGSQMPTLICCLFNTYFNKYVKHLSYRNCALEVRSSCQKFKNNKL